LEQERFKSYPFNILPDLSEEIKLKVVIGDLPSLKKMGEISKTDIYHSFKKYTQQCKVGFKT
jgi:DNA (cytosine-5)-methyltransferase 1